MAALGVEYLRFADGLVAAAAEQEAERRHQELVDTMVKGALVATDRYEERKVFRQYFPETEGAESTDMDPGDSEWTPPDESEIELIQRMLGDTSVTVPAQPFYGDDFAEAAPPMAPPENDSSVPQIDLDREWV